MNEYAIYFLWIGVGGIAWAIVATVFAVFLGRMIRRANPEPSVHELACALEGTLQPFVKDLSKDR